MEIDDKILQPMKQFGGGRLVVFILRFCLLVEGSRVVILARFKQMLEGSEI
jgi:hypothetical protein